VQHLGQISGASSRYLS